MSGYKRDNTRHRKEISSIFKGIQVPQAGEGRRPSGTSAPERGVYTDSKRAATRQKKPRKPKVKNSTKALPKTAPVTQPKTASLIQPKVAPDTKAEASSVKQSETAPVTQPKTSSVTRLNVATVKKAKASSVRQSQTAPVTQSEDVQAEHHKIVPVKRHKVLPTKKQIAMKIQYLKTAGVIWAACFVVFLLAYILILRPQKNSTKRIENELAEKKQVFESAMIAAKKETKDRLNEQIENLKTRMRDFIVDFEDSANLTFQISQIANEKNVASFSIKGKENSVRVAQIDYKYINENHIVINFIGEFSQFATFLNALERHKPVLLVDKFTISRSGQDDSVFRVSLDVSAFVRKQQAEKLLSQENKTTDKRLDKVYGMKI